ncbi:hypothetical protein IJI64_02960 [Candidatus Saccharibacteria bacterium]|nr:hypothetical protein [Candidatus Saccharibacteria bacterium]
MMRRISSFLLMLILSISVMGCGNASASSENANSNNDSTPATENSPVLSQGVSDTTTTDNAVSSETTIETTEDVSEPEPVQNFTGSLYTLPVGAKGEEWTEEQLDEYLKDCKVYQKYCQPNENGKIKVDIDELMKEFGFEYVDTYDGNNVYNIYWKQRGNVKMICVLTDDNHLFVYFESKDDSARIHFSLAADSSIQDDIVSFKTQHINNGSQFNGISAAHLKGVIATLWQICDSGRYDCGRLPYPSDYVLDVLASGSFNLNKSIDFASTDITFETHNVYH